MQCLRQPNLEFAGSAPSRPCGLLAGLTLINGMRIATKGLSQFQPDLTGTAIIVPPGLNFFASKQKRFRQRGFWIVIYSASKQEFLCRNLKGEFPYISRELNLGSNLQRIKECDIRGREIAHGRTDQGRLGRTGSGRSATFRQKNSVGRILPYMEITATPGAQIILH